MGVIKAVNTAVQFLLELCALAALGYWGFHAGSGPVVRFILAIGTPLLAVAAWAVFGAPGAPRPLRGLWRLGLEVLILGCAAVALYAAYSRALALAFAAVALVNEILLYSLGQA